eukprot:TRINITY_DN49591_c0_g1_i1.p1 TRINITY_DN49591_c0_g1~~TRINITY_DN49591_c0_g1_i1.p1  ORF type:complete len:395 (+),score=64.95 TRINITY_DN49591_c0_g1_i1:156-1187(+)
MLTRDFHVLISVHDENADCLSPENKLRLKAHSHDWETRIFANGENIPAEGTTECIAFVNLSGIKPCHALVPMQVVMGEDHHLEATGMASVEIAPKFPHGVFTEADEYKLAQAMEKQGIEYDPFTEDVERQRIIENAFPADPEAQQRVGQSWVHHRDNGDHSAEEDPTLQYIDHEPGEGLEHDDHIPIEEDDAEAREMLEHWEEIQIAAAQSHGVDEEPPVEDHHHHYDQEEDEMHPQDFDDQEHEEGVDPYDGEYHHQDLSDPDVQNLIRRMAEGNNQQYHPEPDEETYDYEYVHGDQYHEIGDDPNDWVPGDNTVYDVPDDHDYTDPDLAEDPYAADEHGDF